MAKIATHPVKLYRNHIYSKDKIPSSVKWQYLRVGMKSLINRGRLVLSAKWYEFFEMNWLVVEGGWGFETLYIGRKAIHRKGIRHELRKSHREFIEQPIKIYF